MRIAINAAILKEGKILVVKKNQTWILPGGKPEVNESELRCLSREVREELSGTELTNVRYYSEFEGTTPHAGDILKARVYFADIKGKLHEPAREISGFKWINKLDECNLSDITSKIVISLIKDGHIRP